MTRRETRLLAIASPFPEAHSVLRLLEPPGSCHKTLWERLSDGTYDKPFIVDSGPRRFLHFDLETVQSAMRLDDPDRLSLRYTRKMMAFLLFNRAPERILLLGLGGGSLAKFCYQRLPFTALTAVEVNPDVIALREEFRIPCDDSRFRVICANAVTYGARLNRSKHVILADACDRAGIAPEINEIEFYQHAPRCLSPGGVFVINMCSDIDRCLAHLAKVRAALGGYRSRPQAAIRPGLPKIRPANRARLEVAQVGTGIHVGGLQQDVRGRLGSERRAFDVAAWQHALELHEQWFSE